ncbi:hypothetical protein [Propionivibrio dicarboxylicus]|uniref:Uncharacterized protein n=1 Tax=Propionivibrio dicarboxylicus TaxID=83767 RepID=A0A1G8LB22_9RHOO|nr:hypothetical protein [Propionivibrio dicarboxylicus]SDI52894.1 hypothetical protein SAMN05660652_03591 [Propionivibrio dicarboxylicus]
MDNKPWYQSKTVLFNIAVAALVALESVTGLLQPFLPVNFYAAVSVLLPVVNAVLRVISSQALTLK